MASASQVSHQGPGWLVQGLCWQEAGGRLVSTVLLSIWPLRWIKCLQNCSTHRLPSRQLHSKERNKCPVHWQSSLDSVEMVAKLMERVQAFFPHNWWIGDLIPRTTLAWHQQVAGSGEGVNTLASGHRKHPRYLSAWKWLVGNHVQDSDFRRKLWYVDHLIPI